MSNLTALYCLIKIFLILIITVTLSTQCKKEEIEPSSNIILKDKPLRVIRANIKGTWKLCYTKGGICVACPPSIKDQEFYEFGDHDRIIWTYKDEKLADTKIIWKYVNDIYNEYTNTLNFFDSRVYSYDYIVDRIINDTLILIDNTYDPMHYYLARSK